MQTCKYFCKYVHEYCVYLHMSVDTHARALCPYTQVFEEMELLKIDIFRFQLGLPLESDPRD